MKKVKIVLFLAIFVLLFSSCTAPQFASEKERSGEPASKVRLVEDKSRYVNFDRDGGTIKIMVDLTFKNESDKKQVFYLIGDFKADVERNLVKERYLRGYNFEDKQEKLTLKPKETKIYNYVFTGTRQDNFNRESKQLPVIKIYRIKE